MNDKSKINYHKLDYHTYYLTFKQVINFIKYEYFTNELPKELLLERMYIFNKFLDDFLNDNEAVLYVKKQNEYIKHLIDYANKCIKEIDTEMLFIDNDLYYIYVFCFCLSAEKNINILNNNFTTKFKNYVDVNSLFC